MQEIKDEAFRQLMDSCSRCIVDYCLIAPETAYRGCLSHKEAVQFAMERIQERYAEPETWEQLMRQTDVSRATAVPVDAQVFLDVPEAVKQIAGRRKPHAVPRMEQQEGDRIPYWYAFLYPPHGTGYGAEDFMKVNAVLFPHGAEVLEVYEWTTDWSDYFADGHEWWGTGCWSVYDRTAGRFTVLMASTTD